MKISYLAGWCFFRLVYATYFRLCVYNAERVPLTGPVILAGNHASYLDPPLIGAGFSRPICYLARDSLFRFPIIGPLLKSWDVIPVDLDGGGAAGLRMIMDRLRQGEGIVLFPEGTRTRDGNLQSPRAGVGMIVIKSAAPVIPVRVFGTYEAYGKRHSFPRPRRIAVKYGRPLHFQNERSEAKVCNKQRLKDIYQEVADKIMARIVDLKPERDIDSFP